LARAPSRARANGESSVRRQAAPRPAGAACRGASGCSGVARAAAQGMPHKVYHGRTGVIWNVTKRAVGVEVNKQVNGRIINKRIHVRVEHVTPSRCKEEFLRRRKENDAAKHAAKEAGGARAPAPCPSRGPLRRPASAALARGPEAWRMYVTVPQAALLATAQHAVHCRVQATRAAVSMFTCSCGVCGCLPCQTPKRPWACRASMVGAAVRRRADARVQAHAQGPARGLHAGERVHGDGHRHPLRHRQGGPADVGGRPGACARQRRACSSPWACRLGVPAGLGGACC